MPKRIDLTGQRFERLVVIEKLPERTKNFGVLWACECDCGNRVTVETARLRKQTTRSCGCLAREGVSQRNYKHGHCKRGARAPEYESWKHMISRCTNTSDKRWNNYGGRGIKVCDRWLNSFDAFRDDMGPRPSADLTLERYDVDGDYCPENCGWEPQAVQSRNTTRTVRVVLDGEVMCVKDAAERLRVCRVKLSRKLRNGVPVKGVELWTG